jgi:hypothetical protein
MKKTTWSMVSVEVGTWDWIAFIFNFCKNIFGLIGGNLIGTIWNFNAIKHSPIFIFMLCLYFAREYNIGIPFSFYFTTH